MVSVQHTPQNPTLAAASTGTFSDTLKQLVFPSVYTKDFDYKVARQARGFLPTCEASWPRSLGCSKAPEDEEMAGLLARLRTPCSYR